MMSSQLSITTTWTCDCGHVNSISNRYCPNCGQHMPSEISQRVYEEEILLHNGVLIDKKKRNLIIATVIIFALIYLRTVLFAVGIIVGIISLLLEWMYIWGSAKETDDVNPQIIKKYTNITFIFSLIFLVIVRITASGMANAVHTVIMIFLAGWIVFIVWAIISASVTKKQNDNKMQNNISTKAISCIPNVIWLAIILWLT